MRVLGVDPGTWNTGYGLLEAAQQVEALDWGVLHFKAGTPLEQRLYQIHQGVTRLLHQHHPDELAIEDPFLGRGPGQYAASAFALGQAHAAAVIAATSLDIPIFHYTPAQVKLATTDYGRASKEQMQELVTRQLGIAAPLPRPDATDALAVALCHVRQQQANRMIAGSLISTFDGTPC